MNILLIICLELFGQEGYIISSSTLILIISFQSSRLSYDDSDMIPLTDYSHHMASGITLTMVPSPSSDNQMGLQQGASCQPFSGDGSGSVYTGPEYTQSEQHMYNLESSAPDHDDPRLSITNEMEEDVGMMDDSGVVDCDANQESLSSETFNFSEVPHHSHDCCRIKQKNLMCCEDQAIVPDDLDDFYTTVPSSSPLSYEQVEENRKLARACRMLDDGFLGGEEIFIFKKQLEEKYHTVNFLSNQPQVL